MNHVKRAVIVVALTISLSERVRFSIAARDLRKGVLPLLVLVFEEEDVNAVHFESPSGGEVVLDVGEAVVEVVALGVSPDSECFDL